MDQNGDGKFDAEDVKVIWGTVRDILSTGVTSAAGFSSGMAIGLYLG